MTDEEKIKQTGALVGRLRREARVNPVRVSRLMGKAATYMEDVESGAIAVELDDFIVICRILGIDPRVGLERLIALREAEEP